MNNDYYFFMGKYLETNQHNAFFLWNYYTERDLIVYRDKNSQRMIGGTDARFNLNEMPSVGFPNSVSEDWFINWYYPGKNDLFATQSTIISEQDKKRVQNLTKNDNPVLVFFKLKEF